MVDPLPSTYDPLTRIWSGAPFRSRYAADTSVAAAIFAQLRQRGAHVAQISDTDGTRMLNGEMLRLAVRVAVRLRREEHVRRGDVLAFMVRNHRLVAPLVLGCMALAAPVSTLDPDFKAEEIVHILRLTRPKVLFCDANVLATVRRALDLLSAANNVDDAAEIVLYTVDCRADGAQFVDDLMAEATIQQLDADERDFEPATIGDWTRHPVAIVCSSGTTGVSKGVAISHALLLNQLTLICDFTDADVFFTFSSLYWISGLITLISSGLFGITRIITTEPFTAERMLRIVHTFGVTVTITAPSYVAQLLQLPAPQVRNALRTLSHYYCGGSAVPVEMVERMDRRLVQPLRIVYGLSELSGVVTQSRCLAGTHVPGLVGVLCAGTKVRLMRCEEEGLEVEAAADDGPLAAARFCAVDEDGEICVQVTYPLLGYYGDAAATAESIVEFAGVGGKWLRTGDVGHFDGDGNLFIVDRLKDILKYRGVQISPTELESVLLQVEGVAEVCVVGLPDGRGSDLPAAVVVRQKRADDEFVDVRAEDLEGVVADKFSDAKRLRGGVWFVDRLPLTPSGKVRRREALRMAETMRTSHRA